jgi:K+-transporting ATPase A subunit
VLDPSGRTYLDPVLKPVERITYALLVIGAVVLVGALIFLPVLSLSPVVEQFLMANSAKLF